MRSRLTTLVLAALLPIAGGATRQAGDGTTPAAPADAPPIVVVLVRHAEKAADDPGDPSLSDAGQRRAEALAALLGRAGVTHLFCSQYRRTRLTLEPLARATGLEVREIPAADGDAQAAALRDLPAGSVAVVAGHSNTVPSLVRALGGDLPGTEQTAAHGEMLGDDQYDRMFMVFLPAPGKGGPGPGVRTLELRYGGP